MGIAAGYQVFKECEGIKGWLNMGQLSDYRNYGEYAVFHVYENLDSEDWVEYALIALQCDNISVFDFQINTPAEGIYHEQFSAIRPNLLFKFWLCRRPREDKMRFQVVDYQGNGGIAYRNIAAPNIGEQDLKTDFALEMDAETKLSTGTKRLYWIRVCRKNRSDWTWTHPNYLYKEGNFEWREHKDTQVYNKHKEGDINMGVLYQWKEKK